MNLQAKPKELTATVCSMLIYLALIIFTRVCHSVHGGAGVVVSQHALQVSRPTPRGEVEGSGLGGSPGPHLGSVSQHALRQTPHQQTAAAAGGTHPTGMHSCGFTIRKQSCGKVIFSQVCVCSQKEG